MDEQVSPDEQNLTASEDPRYQRGGDGYQYFPRDGATDEDEDGARYERPWDAEDGRFHRMLLMGDPNSPPPKMHGHSHSNDKRKPKKIVPIRATTIYLLDEVDIRVVSFSVYGLTKGEVEYYRNRRGEARTILCQCAESIIVSGAFPVWTISYDAKSKRVHNFHIWGMLDLEVDALKINRGTACLALREHAHRMDGNRIRWRDGQNPDYIPPSEENITEKEETAQASS